jgi:DNA-binding NarL/FixJ family response regulator
MHRPRVIIADDHKIVVEGLTKILSPDYNVVMTCDNGEKLIQAVAAYNPDVIVVDITMPKMNGIDAVARIKKIQPGVKVIFLTMHRDIAYVARCFEAGASGYVLKHSVSDELITAIQVALEGDIYIAPSIAGNLIGYLNGSGKISSGLTARQRDVLRLLASGLSTKEIAVSLKISTKTVEYHKYRMMDTLRLKNLAELIAYAIENNILPSR